MWIGKYEDVFNLVYFKNFILYFLSQQIKSFANVSHVSVAYFIKN